MIKLYAAAILAAIAGPTQALVCEYPEESFYQVFKVLGSGQYDRTGIFEIGFPSEPEQKIQLFYTCHQQLDDAITCLRKLDDNSIDAVTIFTSRTLVAHMTLGGLHPMKSVVSVENVVCDE